MKRFTIPRDIYCGKGSIEYLKTLKGNKAILVIDGIFMRKFKLLDKVLSYLKEANIETLVFEDIESEPSVETIKKGALVMSEFNPDWIIAIGGGSPIDAAKAMWVLYEHPTIEFEDIIEPESVPELRNKAKLIAIPSTSGTGSEVTSFSVITDTSKGVKYPLSSYNITPDIAILDPNLAENMPKFLVAYTGLDALTHAIEASVSNISTSFTRPMALEAVVMIFEHLLKSFNGDMFAREKMHYAQCLAGLAFANASLGISHSMAHKSGAIFKIPHGLANAIFLPYVIQYNSKSSLQMYSRIAKSLNIGGINDTDFERTEKLCKALMTLNKRMDIPCNLKDFGLDEKLFLDNVEKIASRSIDDACTVTNPRPVSPKEIEKILHCAYYGKDVRF